MRPLALPTAHGGQAAPMRGAHLEQVADDDGVRDHDEGLGPEDELVHAPALDEPAPGVTVRGRVTSMELLTVSLWEGCPPRRAPRDLPTRSLYRDGGLHSRPPPDSLARVLVYGEA
jgi:hypothetical protein